MMPPPDKIDRRWIFVNAEVILDHLAAALPPREDLDVQKVLCHRAVRRRAARRRHGCPNRAKAQIPSLMRCSRQSRADLARDSPGNPDHLERSCANGSRSAPALAAELQ